MARRYAALPDPKRTSQRTGADLLALVRAHPGAISDQLRGLDPQQIADRVSALPARVREEVLALVENPEQVVPLFSELELVNTLRATGLADAGWLLEFATSEQRVACIDLDCWKGSHLSLYRVGEWLEALVEAGPEVVAKALDEFDPELWVLLMQEMADFAVTSAATPPDDGLTEDGMVWYSPHLDVHESRLTEILRIAITEAPERYWQMVYGAIYETGAEAEEYALLWHKGRLNDLGFPDRERAIQLYSPLHVHEAPVLDAGPESEDSELVEAPPLPQLLRGALVGRALAELPPERAAELLGYVLGVGNAVAIADRLELAEPESIGHAMRKAVRGIDRGLEELAKARRQTPGEILDRTAPFDLFRVGATLDPALRPGRTLDDIEEEEATADWAVQFEIQQPEIIERQPPVTPVKPERGPERKRTT